MRKAFLSIKYHEDAGNRQVVEALSSAIEQAGWKTVCIARDIERWGDVHFAPRELMGLTFKEIEASDLVAIELSEKGVGLGIEAGYAHARTKPIVTIARKGSDISATLQGISEDVLLYGNMGEVAAFFRKQRAMRSTGSRLSGSTTCTR
jgi:2'-deoxynucleoside 5'-phosphate N-hydrolase